MKIRRITIFMTMLAISCCIYFFSIAVGVFAYQIRLEPPEKADKPQAKDKVMESPAPLRAGQRSKIQPTPDASAKPAIDPVDEVLMIAKANKLYGEEKYSDCARILEDVIASVPVDQSTWETLGWSYWKLDEIDKTIDVWKRMASLFGGNPEAHNLLGSAYLSDNQLENASTEFKKSLKLDPNQFEILYSLGAAQRWAGQIKSSIGTLSRCRLMKPDDRNTALQLAKALMSARMYADALPIWDNLLEKTPEDSELLAQYARSLLHQGEFLQALEAAEGALEIMPDNIAALTVVTQVAAIIGEPQEVLACQKLLLKNSKDEKSKIRALQGIIAEDRHIWEHSNGKYDMSNASTAAKQLLEIDPDAVSTHILLGEILILQGKLGEAEEKLEFVLSKFNPRNIRVMRSLFEVYTAEGKFKLAEKTMEKIEDINPLDPYLHYYRARMEFDRGHYREAFDQLDLLEEAGARGSVAVLLYHGLSDNKFDTVMTVERFEEQLQAFRDAKFKFITPLDIKDYFENRTQKEIDPKNYSPERVVAVTFDDARLDALDLGTPIAKKLGIKFAMHVPPPYIDENDFFADWDQLRHYQDTGRWIFGSHLQHASDTALLNDKGTICRPLPNQLWLPDQNRKETLIEYRNRVVHEYAESYDELKENLGEDCKPIFLAYPYGDLGQQTTSDVVDAIELNLEQARKYYRIGFIQSTFGYAVNGDDPLLYQRNEPRPNQSGEQVLADTIANNPVFLARRIRAEFHTQRGDFYAAQKMIKLLERDDYPATKLAELRRHVNGRLSGKKQYIDDSAFKPWWKPVVGLGMEQVEDSTDRSNLRSSLNASLRVLPNLEIGATAGVGTLDQKYSETETGNDIDLQIDEKTYGGRLGLDVLIGDMSMSPIGINLKGGQRNFSGDAEYSQTYYNGMIDFSPRPPLSLQMYYEHDSVPWARSIVAEKTYDLLQPLAVLRPNDFWTLTGAYSNYSYSDDNAADHINLTSMWDVYSDWGLSAGLRYSYLTSDQERDDYWTPYKLNRYMALIEFRRKVRRIYYRLQLRAGMGQEDIRPEVEALYQQNLQEAIANNLAAQPQKPESEWTQVYGFSAEVRYDLTSQLNLRGEASYSELPDYDSTTLRASIEYGF